MDNSPNGTQPPDMDRLFGDYQRHRKWQSELYRQAAHKALNIPTMDGINTGGNVVNNNPSGWKAMLAAGLLGLVGLGGGAYVASNLMKPAETIIKEKEVPGPKTTETIEKRQELGDGKVIPP